MTEKKNPCPDCKMCQWCSDDRCRLCLRSGGCRKKLSMAEQIALYEEGNRCRSQQVKPDFHDTLGSCRTVEEEK